MKDTELSSFLEITKEQLDYFISNGMSEGKLEEAKQLILDAEEKDGRIHFTGIGKPSYVAKYMSSLFSSVGTPAYFLDGTEAIHGSSGQVKPNDVVIAISNSGKTEELRKSFLTLKNNGARIIGVSGNDTSWLAVESDVFLFAGVKEEGDKLNKPPRNSILVEIIVLQSLSIMLQEGKKLDEEIYVKWHPGGSLGESIIKQEENEEVYL